MVQENPECLEVRINALLDADKKIWVHVYKIMTQIEQSNL